MTTTEELEEAIALERRANKIAQAKGGSDDLDNLVLSCANCNSRKGVRSHDQFCVRCV